MTVKQASAAALIALLGAGGVSAKEGVWRYVDPKSGSVTYSNIPPKGVKAEKVEVLQYPSPPVVAAPAIMPPPGVAGPNNPSRRLGDKPGAAALPPLQLPPLPGFAAPTISPAPPPAAPVSPPAAAPGALYPSGGDSRAQSALPAAGAPSASVSMPSVGAQQTSPEGRVLGSRKGQLSSDPFSQSP